MHSGQRGIAIQVGTPTTIGRWIMATATRLSYSVLADQLSNRATRAVLGLRGLRSGALRAHLETGLNRPPGVEGSFLADPVFEAIFGWKQADPTLGDLSGDLLHPDLVRALRDAHTQGLSEDYRFPSDRRPYTHQLAAWQTLSETDPVHSVLVTSGTGSGKTECFLVPILNDLSRELERRQGHPLVGVRALFLVSVERIDQEPAGPSCGLVGALQRKAAFLPLQRRHTRSRADPSGSVRCRIAAP